MNSGHYGFPTILGLLRATAFKAIGKSGATAGATFAGGTTSGAPTTGSFDAGDAVVDQTGKLWICTVTGSPGTWVQAGSGSASPLTSRGDLWGYGSADARVPVGADGLALVADSTQSLGVRWGAPQPSSLLVLLPNANNFVANGSSDEQPPDFVVTSAGDVVGVGGM